jgi:hypothetical protein
MKPTGNNTGQMLELTHEVLDGPHTGVTFTNNLNLENASPVTVDIAYKTLSTICHHIGKIKIKDSKELHGHPLIATLAVRAYTKKDGTEGSANDVKGYDKASADSTSSSAAVVAPLPGETAAAQPTNKPAWAQKK